MRTSRVVFLAVAVIVLALGIFYLYGTTARVSIEQEVRIAEEQIAGNAMTIVALMQSGNVTQEQLDAVFLKNNDANDRLVKVKDELAELRWWHFLVLRGSYSRSLQSVEEVEAMNEEVRLKIARILDPYNPHISSASHSDF